MTIKNKVQTIRKSYSDLPILLRHKGFFYVVIEKESPTSYKMVCLKTMAIFSCDITLPTLESGEVVTNPRIKMEAYESVTKEESPLYPCIMHSEKNNCTCIAIHRRKVIYFNFFGANVLSLVDYSEYSEAIMKSIEKDFVTVKNPTLAIYGSVSAF
jgi:hypothetical protein